MQDFLYNDSRMGGGVSMVKANERDLIAAILTDMQTNGSYSNLLLRKTLNKNNALTTAQKAFVTETVNGVLRNFIYIDYILERFSNTPLVKMKPYVLNVLRMSIYQLLFMDKTPDFAVCNEAVELIKKKNMQGLTGFVNGVLRGVLRGINSLELPEGNTAAYLSVRYSCPMWLTERFIRQYGFECARDMLAANTTTPDVTLCVNTCKATVEEVREKLAAEGGSVMPARVAPNALHVSGTSDMTSLSSFREGLYHVMDESAMLAVITAEPKENMHIIDMCAAPGGKSFATAYLSNDKAKISARDVYDHKTDLLKAGAARLGLQSIAVKYADAEKLYKEDIASADIVLVDAPCSGFGLLRKKPDIRLTRTEGDIKLLAAMQRRILRIAAQYVRPGGILLYSTCTLTKEENEDNAEWFTAEQPFHELTRRTVFPQEYGTDGFFISKFVKE